VEFCVSSALALLLLAQVAVAPDCAAFETRIAEPMAVSVQAIVGEDLGAKLAGPTQPGFPSRFEAGRLTYRGYGVAIRSQDPRFAQIVVDAKSGAHHRCGPEVVGPTGWNALNATGWTLKFHRAAEAAPGVTVARDAGASPVLAGYVPGANWPSFGDGGQVFIGLMHPGSGEPETVVVTFLSRPGPSPAIVLSRLKGRFEALSITPGLHSPTSYLNLEGLAEDGALSRVVLEMSDETRRSLFAEVSAEARSVRP
jgi:hypothetical protein